MAFDSGFGTGLISPLLDAILYTTPSGEDILLRNDRTLKTMYILTEQVLTLRESPVLRQRD